MEKLLFNFWRQTHIAYANLHLFFQSLSQKLGRMVLVLLEDTPVMSNVICCVHIW
jgi:hypothetical protein